MAEAIEAGIQELKWGQNPGHLRIDVAIFPLSRLLFCLAVT